MTNFIDHMPHLNGGQSPCVSSYSEYCLVPFHISGSILPFLLIRKSGVVILSLFYHIPSWPWVVPLPWVPKVDLGLLRDEEYKMARLWKVLTADLK